MGDAISDFFHHLQARGHEPALEQATGTLRFDIAEGPKRTTHWLLTLKRGDVAVSRGNGKADCVVRADRATFDGLVSGRMNAFAALLREAISAEGDLALLTMFQRLLPGPPSRRRRR